MQKYNVGALMKRISLDIMGPLPEGRRGNKYVPCVGDYFIRWVSTIPFPNQEVQTVATALIEHVFSIF